MDDPQTIPSSPTPPDQSMRDGLIAAILAFLAGQDLLTLEEIRSALEREIDGAGAQALMALRERLAMDVGWSYYPRDPLAQRIHHLLADRFLEPESGMAGAEHLPSVTGRPVAFFANHLSYADANVVPVLLQRSGRGELADRLTAIAGPKIFANRQRRFSSLCFGTIKVPQSAGVSSEDAVLSAREVAKAARCSIDVARRRLAKGDALLLFGEGTRSRTCAMQPMLPGVARYLEVPGAWVLPVGLVGPESLFPVGDATIRPARVVMRLGAPIAAGALLEGAEGDRRLVMDAIGLAIAELLPSDYRGVYAVGGDFPAARQLLEVSRMAV